MSIPLTPYRSHLDVLPRHREAIGRIRLAFSTPKEPMLDSIPDDLELSSLMFRALIKKVSAIITEWYAPYLIRELTTAMHYDHAVPAASLLAFSEKPECIDRLGYLLKHSSRPLDVVVSAEALGDLVSYAEPSLARDMAIFHLGNSGLDLARSELVDAIAISPYGYPQIPYRPIPLEVLTSGASSPASGYRYYLPI